MKLAAPARALALVARAGRGRRGAAEDDRHARRGLSISADGGDVAIHAAYEDRATCDSGSVWTPASGKVVRFQDAACEQERRDRQYDALTLAGSRAAWTDYDYGNHAYCNGPVHRDAREAEAGEHRRLPATSPTTRTCTGSTRATAACSSRARGSLCEASCGPDYDRTYDDDVKIWSVAQPA